MHSERWQEVKRVVAEALELSVEERAALLATVKDEEVRKEAERLLDVSATEADRFEHLHLSPLGNDLPFKEGNQVGRYVILRAVSRGGMGAVYQARDAGTGRIVALKILPPRVLPFSANEDKALARLSNEYIATFYESGTTAEGFRYVAMEYVEGVPITGYCAAHCPTVRSRLELFRMVCEAVEYAHRNLVVHRDIKPDNILVTSGGKPKLLDFGIAKILPSDLELATLTRGANRPLTVAFASPEQLGGDPTTTATDVYSLGVLLCLLLTGHLPYKVKSFHDLPWAIRNMGPERPSTLVASEASDAATGALPEGGAKRLRRRLEGDLDAIILRALRKEPDLRYRSAAELSEDVRRYLDHEPVAARRGTRRYRAGKFIERHRIGVAAGVTALLVLLAFLLTLFVLRREAVQERDASRREAARAQTTAGFLVNMFKVSNPWTSLGTPITAREVLDDAARKLQAAPPADPAVRGTLLRSLGKINVNLGNYAAAEAPLEGALRDLRATSGDHAVIAELSEDLSTVRYHQARYRDAERYALEAVREFKETPGVRSLLGRIAFAKGDYVRAEALFREALPVAEQRFGPSSLQAGNAAHDLACTLHSEGRYDEAAALYNRTLAIRRRLLGERHQAVVQVLHNLACLTRDRGNLPKAESELWAVRMGYRALSDPDFPNIPTLFHNMGSTLISEGKLDEAEEPLFDSLSGFRFLLPDEHPHTGRAYAELGRLFYARGRYADAERYCREGLKRLKGSLGTNHPDTITAANSLGAILAREGKAAEALGTWKELLQAHPLRRDLETVLRENLALLGQEKSARQGTFSTVGIEILDLTETPDYTDAGQGLSPLPRPKAQYHGIVRFFDDFNDGVIDPKKWEVRGAAVREVNGILRVLTMVTDRGGQARTLPISIDPARPLVISRRVKVHAANEYFDGKMVVEVTGYPEKSFGVTYADYRYTGAGEVVTVGFSVFRRNASPHRYAERRANVSQFIPPLFDRWFDEELRYDPKTGEARYSIDGRERLAYNVGPLPPNASTITLTFFPWGWYTGHSQEIDWVRVEQ